MAIFGARADYDAGPATTTYEWVICRAIPACPTPVAGTPDIAQFRVDLTPLDACGGVAAHPIQSGTTEPYSTSDPACFGNPGTSVVKWPVPVGNGACLPLVLILGGELETGTVDAGTITGQSCPLVAVEGPACTNVTP